MNYYVDPSSVCLQWCENRYLPGTFNIVHVGNRVRHEPWLAMLMISNKKSFTIKMFYDDEQLSYVESA